MKKYLLWAAGLYFWFFRVKCGNGFCIEAKKQEIHQKRQQAQTRDYKMNTYELYTEWTIFDCWDDDEDEITKIYAYGDIGAILEAKMMLKDMGLSKDVIKQSITDGKIALTRIIDYSINLKELIK